MAVHTQVVAFIKCVDADGPSPHKLSATYSAPRSQNGACLETMATTIKGMGMDDLILLESLVAARQQELM